MELDHIVIGKSQYPVHIHYEKRSNSRVSIGKRGVYIRIPTFMDRKEKAEQVRKFKEWAEETLKKKPGQYRPRITREYRNGEKKKVGEREYTLKISHKDKKSSSACLRNSFIEFSLSSRLSSERKTEVIATLLSRCIGRERLPKLREKIEELNEYHFKVKLGKIFFKYNKASWGSCSGKGNINISTRLLFAPDDVLEYVCIHELAHLREMNHSTRFWALVKRAMPDFKEKILWLKDNRDDCWF